MKHKRWAFDLLLCCCLSLCGLVHASTVPLTQSVDLPIVVEGRTVGSMKLPAGSEVEIVSNDGTNAVIKRGGTTYTIAADSLPSTSEPAAPAASTSSAQPTPIAKAQEAVAPILSYKPIDKTLNESTMVPFFIPKGEHSPSIIDASRLNDEMPGKNGWLSVKNGHLYNGEKRLRIAGVNVFLPVTDNDIAEMKKYGFNGVRISVPHTFNKKDNGIGPPTHTFFKGQELDPVKLHELDDSIAKFIKAGFWIDLRAMIKAHPGQADDDMRELDKKYLSALFKHVNPYTGRSYANEPAIFAVEVANEDGLEVGITGGDDHNKFEFPLYQKQITAKWNKWLTDRYKTQEGLDAAWPGNTEKLGSVAWMAPPKTRELLTREEMKAYTAAMGAHPAQQRRDWWTFALDTEISYSKDLVSFIHNELRYPGLVMTGCSRIKLATRNQGDAVMIHCYGGGNDDAVCQKGLEQRAYERIYGKPLFMNEFNKSVYNPYFGGSALSALATATAQDWDGVFYFRWNQNYIVVINTVPTGPENMIKGEIPVEVNPALMASLPTAINLFRRGDIAPLKEKFSLPFNNIFRWYDTGNKFRGKRDLVEEPGHLLDHQVGLVFPENPLTQEVESFGEQGTYSYEGKNLTVTSPKTVISIGTSTNKELGGFRFEIGKTQLGWTCASVTSLDNDLPIKDATKLLVTLIGKTGNTGSSALPRIGEEVTVLEDGGTNAPITKEAYLKAFGTAPVITECISANVFIPVDTSKGTFKAYALDEKAQRKGEIPLEVTADGITLHTTGKEGTVWYEIARK